MRVVSNTSPLSNLAIIGRLDLLKQRYSTVRVPPAVSRELAALPIRTNGDWEGWLKFFLGGAAEVSQAATGDGSRDFETAGSGSPEGARVFRRRELWAAAGGFPVRAPHRERAHPRAHWLTARYVAIGSSILSSVIATPSRVACVLTVDQSLRFVDRSQV